MRLFRRKARKKKDAPAAPAPTIGCVRRSCKARAPEAEGLPKGWTLVPVPRGRTEEVFQGFFCPQCGPEYAKLKGFYAQEGFLWG